MHFALPPRKTSNPPLYVRTSARSSFAQHQRRRIQQIAVAGTALILFLVVIHFFSWHGPPTENGRIPDNPKVVIVTMFDDHTPDQEMMDMVKANRDDYAGRHGYHTFYTNTSTYHPAIGVSPVSWSLIPCLRHAMNLYPTASYLWYLDPLALITNPDLSLDTHIFHPLEQLMLRDIPVVPPDSVIHTYSHLRPSDVHLIISQDLDNVAHTSFILRNVPVPNHHEPADDWTHYFLDAWFDPLYRMYGFQKAENHALEHMIQWHPTILTKVALIPQRTINSYTFNSTAMPTLEKGAVPRTHDSQWQEGDLVVNLRGCRESSTRDCMTEMREYYEKWQKEVSALDRS